MKNFKGYLHTDGYGGYHSLPVTVVGCWAHLRRKFNDAVKALPKKDRAGCIAMRGRKYCDKLFEFEESFTDANLTPEERYLKRQEYSVPLIEEFYTWIDSLGVVPKSLLGTAVHYALSQRPYLENYLLDGRLEASNNRAERSIKTFVIDRKNFLFANSQKGAKACAVIMSMIETAKENGLDPYQYLTYVFKNAPNWDIKNNRDALKKLLPFADVLPKIDVKPQASVVSV